MCRVSQGSILGTLLFVMFKMIYHFILNVSSDMYVDDTTLYIIGETHKYSKKKTLQNALQNLCEWCKLNGMLLDVDKTKAMLKNVSIL